MTEPQFDRAEIERALRERAEALNVPLKKLSEPPERGALLGFGKRIGDGTTEAISRITEVGVGSSLEQTAEQVARALEKLDEGTYGLCDSCAKPIAPARLKVRPESVLCIDCASAVTGS